MRLREPAPTPASSAVFFAASVAVSSVLLPSRIQRGFVHPRHFRPPRLLSRGVHAVHQSLLGRKTLALHDSSPEVGGEGSAGAIGSSAITLGGDRHRSRRLRGGPLRPLIGISSL